METHLEKKKGQLIYTVASGSEVSGYVVIDSMVAGRSCGGLRMLPDVDKEEMSGLARSMTLKYGFLGLPQGGAKAGVRGDPASPRSLRWRLLKDFAGAIEPLLKTHTYAPGADMGTDNADIRYLLHSIGFSIKRRELRENHSGYYTARTVLAGVIQAAGHLALSLEGCTAAIEDFVLGIFSWRLRPNESGQRNQRAKVHQKISA
jgi:glutamate dehydrogenase/leucine dehydrogenase